uniref:Uncharacterized protein n=1 Tax=Oryza sativa subsp. japonica TaxID=39947 RepID=Q7XB70_ORYSJ|nr:hypothetical protein [Oryza sativa Japonica Group]
MNKKGEYPCANKKIETRKESSNPLKSSQKGLSLSVTRVTRKESSNPVWGG